jgi:hypothetical protein
MTGAVRTSAALLASIVAAALALARCGGDGAPLLAVVVEFLRERHGVLREATS